MAPWYYFLCVGASVFIMALSKGGFGGGVGILSVPLMALAMGPIHMLGVMLPVLIVCDLLSNLHYLHNYDFTRVRWMISGAIPGIVIGGLFFVVLGGISPAAFNRLMTGLIGGLCLGIVAMQVYRLFGHDIPTLPPHPVSGVAVGLVAGTVSTLNHAAGPITTLYLLQERLEKRRLVGTLLLYTLIGNTLKVPVYLLPLQINHYRPLINFDTLRDSIWFVPLIPLGTLLGAWLNRRVSEKPFAVILYLFAALAAGQMVYKATTRPPVVRESGVKKVDKVTRGAAPDSVFFCPDDAFTARFYAGKSIGEVGNGKAEEGTEARRGRKQGVEMMLAWGWGGGRMGGVVEAACCGNGGMAGGVVAVEVTR